MAKVIETCRTGEYPYQVFVTVGTMPEEKAAEQVARYNNANPDSHVKWEVVPDGYKLEKLFSEGV